MPKEKTYTYHFGNHVKKITKKERDELVKKSLESSEDKPKEAPKNRPKESNK